MSNNVECGTKYEIEIDKEANHIGEVIDVDEDSNINKKKRNNL